MGYFELSCVGNGGNTGAQKCQEDFGRDELFLLVDSTFEIDTFANAMLEATYITAINAAVAERMYPLFIHFNAEFENEDRIPAEGWAGKSMTVRAGKRKGTYTFEEISFYNHKELRKHNGRTGLAIYKVTSGGYIKGWSKDGIKLLPFPLDDFFVNDRSDDDGANKDLTSVFIEEADGSKWNDDGFYVKPTAFDPLLLDGIKDCSVTIASETATSGVLTINGASDQIGIIGLLGANFRLYADSAPETSLVVTLGTDNGDGTYDVTWTSISGAHTITLFAQPIGTSGFMASPLNGSASFSI